MATKYISYKDVFFLSKENLGRIKDSQNSPVENSKKIFISFSRPSGGRF